MLYDPAGVQVLIADLGKYETSITEEQQKAIAAEKSLTGIAWQGGADGGAAAFKHAHVKLMGDMDDLLINLKNLKGAVEKALAHAQATDGSVADDFYF
ncbi:MULTISPECIES: hypothetical protein [Nocardia]|uniref:hypothetical protein n=1 Tax=Nocardia TaxID=1817 RepID=UPI0006F5D29B|nr:MULTISPECIES: hypothetical protein [Nocardia]KQY32179.1 hypothetical protein ASD42_21480 [Nocardia sp. Root136]